MLEKEGKQIIVSADDFGISRWANENILKLTEKNKLNRIEIMISNNLKPEHVSKLLNSSAKLDIHFHLAKDRLDYWQNNPRIIEKRAAKRIIFFMFNYFFGETRPRIVEKEWENQLLMFQKIFGRNPDGASSHEHIHFFPAYFKVLVKLSLKYSIPYIRFGRYYLKEENKICAILNWLRRINLSRFKKSDLNSSDYMVSFDWISDWEEFIKKAPSEKTIEVVFHPELDLEYNFLNSQDLSSTL